jgi:UDP:flavonoid glycosyltransferase YjiC (YdhE family)
MENEMAKRSILFVSWQGGLGHVTRDLAIVSKLRQRNPYLEVSWIAHPLAAHVLRGAGETLLPESQFSADYNEAGVPALGCFKLNLMKYVRLTRKARDRNVALFKQVVAAQRFDLVIGDESYEVADAMQRGRIQMDCRMIMIEDFVGLVAMTQNPLEKLGIYLRNRERTLHAEHLSSRLIHLFVGELEDIPDRPFGFLLPNQREFARKQYRFLGYVIRFDPAEYANKAKIRAKLGYGREPLLICATGGTSAGKELLETCGRAYSIVKSDIPDLRMVAVCGELFGSAPPALPPEVELHGYIPDLYQHYAACDMAVVVGGGTTTIELTALRRPFVFFPLEDQFDQQLYVAERLSRQGAGIKMRYHQTTPGLLAQTIRAHIGEEAQWMPIRIDGAKRAAELIDSFLAD